MRRLVISFFMVLLMIMVMNGCQSLPAQTSEETPNSSELEESANSSNASYSLVLKSSELLKGYKGSFVLNENSVVVGVQSYGDNEASLELNIFSISDSTYTKTYKVFENTKSSCLIPVSLVGGWDENHVWMIHSGPGSLTLFYQSNDSTHSINLEEECGITDFSYANEGKTLYMWRTPKNFWVLQFKENGISKEKLEIAQNGVIKSIIPEDSAGDFYVVMDSSVLRYESFNKVDEFGFRGFYIKDIKFTEDGSLCALVSSCCGNIYLVNIDPTMMTEVSSKLIIDVKKNYYEANYIIPYSDKIVVLLSEPKSGGDKMEYYAVYDDEFNVVVPATTVEELEVYPGDMSVQNPGYGVDSDGNLWFFLQQKNPKYDYFPQNRKLSHVLLILDKNASLLTYSPNFDRVDNFALENDLGIVIEYEESSGREGEYIKTFSLEKSE